MIAAPVMDNAQPIEPSVPIRLTVSLAPDFMENRLSDVHPMFSPLDAVYDDQNHGYTRNGASTQVAIRDTVDMTAQRDVFMVAVREYERKVGAKHGITWSANATSSWDDVLQHMQAANAKYLDVKKDGIMGNFRHCLRNFNKFSKPVNAWLKLLPESGWQGSLVCGGLKLILGVRVALTILRSRS